MAPEKSMSPMSRTASLALMVASGFAGLGYQIVWTQQCALWLGHESAAVLAVVSAFFGGLALGALLMGPRIERSAQPVRWYAACELIIAAWGLVLWMAMSTVSQWLLELTGSQPEPAWQWLVAFIGTFVLLLPATAAMGATLPAMERVTAQLADGTRSIAAHYAANTFGAVLGVLGASFWLIPAFGLAQTAGVCIVLNLLCAGLALLVLPRRADVQEALRVTQTSSTWRITAAHLALTGLLGIGYEVLVVRVLSQVAEDTVYTFAMLLAVYLVGTSLGAAIYQRWLVKSADLDKLGDRLLGAVALACLVGTSCLWMSDQIRTGLLAYWAPGMAASIATEAAMALAAFGLPTMVMGALFSHLCARANASGLTFGQALGINTLGAAMAPPLFGVLLTPLLGPKGTLLLISAGYVTLCTPPSRLQASTWAPTALALALALWAPPLRFVTVHEGGHIVSYNEGAMAAVSVVEDTDGVARLRINNRQQEGSTSSLLVDARQALLPLLLHPAPRHALFLGLGTGVTSGSAAQDPSVQVDAVELLPEVIEASRHFRRVFDTDAPNPRLHVMAADARRHVRTTDRFYDVIVSDNFQPARSGSGALYTVEHFQAVKKRLTADGLFCQWLPLHQMDLATLRSIVQSFMVAYPGGMAILASNSLETPVLGLVGIKGATRFDPMRLHLRLSTTQLPRPPAAFGIEDELALLGSIVAGPHALTHFAANAAPNTDDHPVVAYMAPRITYAPDSLPRDRLIALLRELSVTPAEVLTPASDAAWSKRLAAYWAARNRFIDAGRAVQPSGDVRDMLAQVREPLLSVLRTSPDFRPAYDPLVHMAMALAQSDRPAARTLLQTLNQIQPARHEASQALHQLADLAP
jgi:spermidine synthase